VEPLQKGTVGWQKLLFFHLVELIMDTPSRTPVKSAIGYIWDGDSIVMVYRHCHPDGPDTWHYEGGKPVPPTMLICHSAERVALLLIRSELAKLFEEDDEVILDEVRRLMKLVD
jgi:hypothetical protein